MDQKIESFIIIGATRKGETFRPSDWADRLCGIMATFGNDNRVKYSQFVRPGCSLTGQKTVIVDARLHQANPTAYQFVVDFARSNDLQVEPIDDDQI
ncbi:MAG: DUF3579 domain-containing protein [Azoarcus sp.]|jgi:hypothetical protein|nr:DUF3579 domain-containing protein [Azoarcus sp.]